MSTVLKERVTVTTDEKFVVFLIGMRFNSLWKIHKWLPVARSMTHMITELYAQTESGFLSHEMAVGKTLILVQYWRSIEQLQDYSHSTSKAHRPAWKAFNNAVGSNGDVGIWHETYPVRPGEYECVYNNMPLFGLGSAFGVTSATGTLTNAKQRLTRAVKQVS